MRMVSGCRWLRSRRGLTWGALVVVAGAIAGPNAWAWYQLRAGRSALEAYHPEEGRDHLSRCLRLWPNSVSAHRFASRAARQCGDFEEADRQLRACQTLLGETSDDIALEWALLQAAGGNVREVEEYLQARIEKTPELEPLVWEALAEGYIRVYRILDALALQDHWLQVAPDNLRALELRGLAYQNGKSAVKGAADFRRVLEKDEARSATRWRLVLCLLDMGAYDEAMPHVERIARERPGDPDVAARLARCQSMLGEGEQAERTLEATLAQHPDHGLALRTRGQLALANEQLAQAEYWLRRAAESWPNDYLTHWLLGRALQQQPDKEAEARIQLQIADEVKLRAERLGELRSRKLSERPLDPALHYEMGMLLWRSGHPGTGESWLRSALDHDPEFRPAHLALAELYESRGETQRAAEHRRRAR
jgi:tetratricopeptide (TPR) repeat protein